MKYTVNYFKKLAFMSDAERTQIMCSFRDSVVQKSLEQDALVDKKYEVVNIDDKKVIRALRSFADIKKGQIGGVVDSEFNLSHHGNSWIYQGSSVTGNARVMDDFVVGSEDQQPCIVKDNAILFGNGYACGNVLVQHNAIVEDSDLDNYHPVDLRIEEIDNFTLEVRDNALVYGSKVLKNSHIVKNAALFKSNIYASLIVTLFHNSNLTYGAQYVSNLNKHSLYEFRNGYLTVNDIEKTYEEWYKIVTNYFRTGKKYPKLYLTANQYMMIKNICIDLERHFRNEKKVENFLV